MDVFLAFAVVTAVALIEFGAICILAARVGRLQDQIQAGRFGPQHYWPGGRQHER